MANKLANFKLLLASVPSRKLSLVVGCPIFLMAAFMLLRTLLSSNDTTSPTPKNALDQTRSDTRFVGDNGALSDARRQPDGDASDGLVKLPIQTIRLLNVDAIDDVTGALNSQLTEMLLLSATEGNKVNQVFAEFFAHFLEIEANHSSKVSSENETYIAVGACASEAKPLFASLFGKLSEILGKKRAESLCVLVKKELRNGGAEPLEVGFVIINEKGDGAITLKGGPYGQTEIRGRLNNFARWKVLSERFFSN